MGAHASTDRSKEAPTLLLPAFEVLPTWGIDQVLRMVTDFQSSDCDFAVDYRTLSAIMGGGDGKEDLALARDMVSALAFNGGDRISILSFLAGALYFCGGGEGEQGDIAATALAQRKMEGLVLAFDFSGSSSLSFDEGTVLLLCLGQAIVCMTGEGRLPTAAEMESVARGVLQHEVGETLVGEGEGRLTAQGILVWAADKANKKPPPPIEGGEAGGMGEDYTSARGVLQLLSLQQEIKSENTDDKVAFLDETETEIQQQLVAPQPGSDQDEEKASALEKAAEEEEAAVAAQEENQRLREERKQAERDVEVEAEMVAAAATRTKKKEQEDAQDTLAVDAPVVASEDGEAVTESEPEGVECAGGTGEGGKEEVERQEEAAEGEEGEGEKRKEEGEGNAAVDKARRESERNVDDDKEEKGDDEEKQEKLEQGEEEEQGVGAKLEEVREEVKEERKKDEEEEGGHRQEDREKKEDENTGREETGLGEEKEKELQVSADVSISAVKAVGEVLETATKKLSRGNLLSAEDGTACAVEAAAPHVHDASAADASANDAEAHAEAVSQVIEVMDTVTRKFSAAKLEEAPRRATEEPVVQPEPVLEDGGAATSTPNAEDDRSESVSDAARSVSGRAVSEVMDTVTSKLSTSKLEGDQARATEAAAVVEHGETVEGGAVVVVTTPDADASRSEAVSYAAQSTSNRAVIEAVDAVTRKLSASKLGEDQPRATAAPVVGEGAPVEGGAAEAASTGELQMRTAQEKEEVELQQQEETVQAAVLGEPTPLSVAAAEASAAPPQQAGA